MKKGIVKQIVQELASENFEMYPESYPVKNGLPTKESTIMAKGLGIIYWDHRDESEVERDEELSITKADYVDWVIERYEAYVQDLLTNYLKVMINSKELDLEILNWLRRIEI